MARPRIFISSTFYDLKNVRADLDKYIKERGFDPVLSERGDIAYGSMDRLEEYCYKEISTCDVLVSIIGGTYGSKSASHGSYSISQKELKTAIDHGKQVYIFINRDVMAEYNTYKKNKENASIKYSAVDNKKVYEFIEEIMILPMNNPIAAFETSSDIIKYLQEQWAGLFQRLLQESSKQREANLIEDLKKMSDTLKQLITFLTSEKDKGDQTIYEILLSNHPIFEQLRRELHIPVPFLFRSYVELEQFLEWMNFHEEEKNIGSREDIELVWRKIETEFFSYGDQETVITINRKVFDGEWRLKIFTPEEWDPSYLTVEKNQYVEEQAATEAEEEEEEEDGLPF